MKKRNKEIIIIGPLIAITLVTLVGYTIVNTEEPETFTAIFIEYNGEMIGGEVSGNIIILMNGTYMGLDEFKKITGYDGPT